MEMDLKAYIKIRSSLKCKLTIFKKHLDTGLSCEKLSTVQIRELTLRLAKIKTMYSVFDKTQTEIESLSDIPESEVDQREEFEGIYFGAVAAAEELLLSSGEPMTGHDHKPGTATDRPNFKLPTIHLPTFSGRYQDWLGYHDTYTSLIHNNQSIPKIHKFHYLRASLQESAALVIQSLDFSAENYDIAWQLLCDRFHNDRLLGNNHINALFNIEPLTQESSGAIRKLIDTVNKNLRALKILTLPTEYWDFMIIWLVYTKLDPVTAREWEEKRCAIKGFPTLEQLIEFLKGRADMLEIMEEAQSTSQKASDTTNRQKAFIANETSSKSASKCSMCNKGSHAIFKCFKFKALPVEKRIEKVKELNLCLICLRKGHGKGTCTLGPCKICTKKHNSLLHLEEKPKSNPAQCVVLSGTQENTTQQNTQSEVQTHNNITLSSTHQSHVLLSTAIVGVMDHNGQVHKVRALLDNGSTSSFITERLHAKLKLPSYKTCVSVQGLNKQHSHITNRCDIKMLSLTNSGFNTKVNCFIVTEITQLLPRCNIDTTSFNSPTHIHLADPTFHRPSEVQMLLGADIFWQVLCNNHIFLGKHKPSLNETKLGWLVSGVIHNTNHSFNLNDLSESHTHIHSHSTETHSGNCNSTHNKGQDLVYCKFINNSDIDLQNSLDHYFECENINSPDSLSRDDQECEKLFTQTTTRLPNGRFVVEIPLKQSPSTLGESKEMALARFFALEHRFQRDSVFKHKYIEFMTEYIQLGHMCETTAQHKYEYFLPHHGVLNETSLTTKLRTVFDASAATSTGISFNSIQRIGPTMQDDLLSILIRFRQHKYIVTADIDKFYRQILVTPSQRPLQKIFWRSDTNAPLKIYQLNTITYGTASAPYLATRCLIQLGRDCANESVSSTILHDFYIDDLVTGSDDAAQLIRTCKGVIHELESAQLHLRKWRSNDTHLMDKIHDNGENKNDPLLTIKNENNAKILGVTWNLNSDSILFSPSLTVSSTSNQTKRTILSTLAQIFDPLGLINPCLLQVKLILQQLWINNSLWDSEIPDDLRKQWEKFIKHLPCLQQHIQIPRRVVCDSPVRVELHTFCDASKHAYSACVYVRSTSSDGKVHVHLLIAKSRVAPFKRNMTIPKLELCGAVLAAQLAKKVKSSLSLQFSSETYWCDSTIVLGWIQMAKSKLKQYILNRVNIITDNTKGCDWNHVPTEKNPADIGSRGMNFEQLRTSDLWWSGCDYLHNVVIVKPPQPQEYIELPEMKPYCHLTFTQTLTPDFISYFSNFTKLRHVLAYIQRFIHNCCNPQQKIIDKHLQISELEQATKTLCKMVQKEMFNKQYQLLKNKHNLSPKDQLVSLNPFMDSEQLLRVGGRLSNSNYDYNTKHPILLHANHHITQLIVRHHHVKLMHAGPQQLLSILRHTFWIIGGRSLTRKTVRNCVTCCRFAGKSIQPIMGNLPEERLHAEYPFQNTAVDYAGPIMIADRKGRGCKLIKSYICVFVCLAVRAVHIELVTELSTESFLAALNRFIARRGMAVNIFSDNGTNFVGAYNELSKFLKSKSHEISTYAAENKINFHFSPAYSPHFNGLAEGSVKSVKHHLKRVLGLANLTYEEMSTLLIQIEGILNSRPLTPLSADPSDLVALTPSHFLIGRTPTSLPTPQVPEDENRIHTLTRHKRVQALKAQFWRRYQRDYIIELQKRSKWSRPGNELHLHQLVIVKDDRLPPNRWLLGRIERLYPGTDGVARVADVYTTTGTLRRAYNRLVPLPILEQDVPRAAGC